MYAFSKFIGIYIVIKFELCIRNGDVWLGLSSICVTLMSDGLLLGL